jgi:uncharacterized delta-60 repeat protein
MIAKKALFGVLFMVPLIFLQAQVAVNDDQSAVDPSAMLDVQSTGKGFLPPRMNEIDKLRISNPAAGLVIYNTDCHCLNFYNGNTWVSLENGSAVGDPLFYQLAVGGTGDEAAHAIIQVSDGGYLMVGSTSSYGEGEKDLYAVKLTADFQLDNGFGTNGTFTVGAAGNEVGRAVVELSDGSFIIAGYSYSLGAGGADAYVVKLTAAGAPDNSFGTNGTLTIGTSHNERAYDIIVTSDGGFLLCGYTYHSSTTYDAYLVKLTPLGSLDNNFGTNGTFWIGGSENEYTYQVIETSDGGFAVIATTFSYQSNADIFVFKLTAAGVLDASFGSAGGVCIGGAADDWGGGIRQTADGGYIVVGNTYSYGAGSGYNDAIMVKLTSAGALDNTFGTNGTLVVGGGNTETFGSVIIDDDGSYVAAGNTFTYGSGIMDFYIVKVHSDGTPDDTFGTGGIMVVGGAGEDYCYDLIKDNDGNYVLAGYTSSFGAGGQDAYIIKLNRAGLTCGNMDSGGSFSCGGVLSNYTPGTGSGGSLGCGGSTSSGGILTLICQ